MEELTGLDARFLYSETPTAHMHTMKVVVLDLSGRTEILTPETFAAELATRLDRMPVFRKRAVSVPHQVSHPVWVEAPFDAADHILWRRVEAPGDRRILAAAVAVIAGTPLPRDRPLWEMTVVEGLADGRVAIALKLHHALADGVAAAGMLENVFQPDPARAVVEPARPEPLPSPERLRRHAWHNRLARTRRLPSLAAKQATGLAAARRARRGHGVRATKVFAGPRTAINVSLSPQRTFAVTDLAMAEVAEVKTVRGVTVNDVFLAVCSGALRRHLGAPAARRGGLIAGVPIGVPGEGLRLTGNRLDHMVVALRTDLDDPLERLAAISASVKAAKAERAALGHGLFEDRAGHTPPNLYPTAIRLWASTHLANRLRPPLNLIASNVAGPRDALELEGGLVTELWSVGPILEGIGLNLTAWSYDGVLRVSALGCPESLPDPWALMREMDAALAELLAAVRSPADLT